MILVPAYEARLASYIVFGLCMLTKSLPYVWAAEVSPPNKTTLTSVSITSFDAATVMVACLYFLVISRDWFPLCMFMTAIQSIGLIYAIIFIPESPRWLLDKGRVSEAIGIFNYIAK